MKKYLLLLCCIGFSSLSVAYADQPKETWNITQAESDINIYGNYTPKTVTYYLSVDSVVNRTGLTPDTITINCAGTAATISAGHAVACVMPPDTQLSWMIKAGDFHHGSQGKKGKMDSVAKAPL